MSTLLGHRLTNRYDIHSLVGQGGMGVVYRGYDNLLKRAVAIKTLPLQLTIDPVFVQRFQQEAVIAAGLHHPGIVTIHDVGVHPGERQELNTYFIVMEFLEGVTLDQWLQNSGAMPLDQVNHVVDRVAEALDYAHEQGLIHRDIKPSNIMIGSKGRVTLMDFGLVRAGESSGLTHSSVVMGTPDYMAPEQALGQSVDWRADIYALGVVTYKLLTGIVPFTRTTPMAVALAHAYEPPPPLRSLRSDLPKSVEAVVMKALAKNPAERYQRASDLARDLSLSATGKVPAGLKVLPTPPAGLRRAVATTPVAPADQSSPIPPVNTISSGHTPTQAKPSTPSEAVTILGVPGAQRQSDRKRSGMLLPMLAVSSLTIIAILLFTLRSGTRLPMAEVGVYSTATAQVFLPQTDRRTAIVTVQADYGGEPITPEISAADTSVLTMATWTATSVSRPTHTLIATKPTPTPRPPTVTPMTTVSSTPTTRLAVTASNASATPAVGGSGAGMYQVAPALLNPANGANASADQSFSWRWDGPSLRPDERFEWRLQRSASGENLVDARIVATPGVTFSMSGLPGGEYYWTVRVVQATASGQFVALRSPEAARQMLRWNPPTQIPPTHTPAPPPATFTPTTPPTHTPVPPPATFTPTTPPTHTPAPPPATFTPTTPPTHTPAPPPATFTPTTPPTHTPAPPPSGSFVPAARSQDVQDASTGGAFGVGLFLAVVGLTSWRQRRKR